MKRKRPKLVWIEIDVAEGKILRERKSASGRMTYLISHPQLPAPSWFGETRNGNFIHIKDDSIGYALNIKAAVTHA